jgi:hypothetical protein
MQSGTPLIRLRSKPRTESARGPMALVRAQRMLAA